MMIACGQLLRGSATLRAAAQLAGPCHDVDHLLENLELDALAAAGAYEFGFIVQPLKIREAPPARLSHRSPFADGATNSRVRRVAR